MKIGILGAGSLGCTFGGLLTEAGHDLWMIGRKQSAHIKAMKKFGLTLVDGPATRNVSVKVATNCREVGVVDLLMVLVKSYATCEALDGAKPMIGKETITLSLQNGLGNEELLIEQLGKERVIGGKTYVGGNVVSPGRVMIGTRGKLTWIGEWDGTISERVNRIAGILTQAGVGTRGSTDIRAVIWSKLLVNVATGAISSITRLPYGELEQVREAVECGEAAVAEALAVAKADGVDLGEIVPQEIWEKAMEGLPFDFRTSMLQDIEKGSQTEIDFINGAVVRRGQRLGVPTPVNRALVAGIKGIEHALRKGRRQ